MTSKKQGWQNGTPVCTEEQYIEGINECHGSDLGVLNDNAAKNCNSLTELTKDFVLFTPVIFYGLFRSRENSEPLGNIIGNKIKIMKTSPLPVKIVESTMLPPNDKEDYILYGVVKEHYPLFSKVITTAILKDTPKKEAFALDLNDVKISDLKGSYLIIKYIRVIGMDYVYEFPKPEHSIGIVSVPRVILTKTEKAVTEKLKFLFTDPTKVYAGEGE